MEIHIQNAIQSMPLSRNDLFTDVVHNRAYGDISQVWQCAGHILITADEGRKLFTFDSKPIKQQHVLDSKCLDISALSTPLIDVLMLSPHLLALIDTSGQMMLWKFTTAFSWSYEGRAQLCTSSGAEIISITYLPGCSTIVWCQRQPTSLSSSSTYCICMRRISLALDPKMIREQSRSSVLIQNCPSADVNAISNDSLFISTQFHPEQVTLHLAFDLTNNHLSLFVGDECVNYPVLLAQDVVDFQEVVMMSLPVVIKTEPGKGDCGVRSDSSTGQAAVLSSRGELEVFSCESDSGKTKLSKKTITLACEIKETDRAHTRHWFLHRGHVGIICDSTVHVFRLKDGKQVCKSIQANVGNVQKVVRSTSPVFLAWVLTSEHLFALQGVETKNKEMYTAADKLPDDHLLQTYILRLAHFHEVRMVGSNQTLGNELEQLKKAWTDVKNLSHHSHIPSTIAPYLEEYWRLESLSQALLDSEKHSVIKAEVNSAEHMVKAQMDIRSFSKAASHAKLLWLSIFHPQELLGYLCQGITFESDVIAPGEMKKWQSLLGMEGGTLMNFEFVCRLLFQLMPEKLLNFVKCAESASEQIVGVSAFVRKKYSLIYYKTAWECLPHSQTSCDPKTAASVNSKLILASESEDCVERALKSLLQHGLWSEAVELVKGQASSEGLPVYLHFTIKALSESNVLSDYTAELFAIMPSWKSFLSFSQLATERPEVRQQQLSNSAKDVFFQGASDVRLADVRPFLQNLIRK